MAETSTVQKWNIPEIGVEEDDREEVTSIFCKICREFYANNNGDVDDNENSCLVFPGDELGSSSEEESESDS